MKAPCYASYDLHLHTCWSYDATAPAKYYFKRAEELKLRAIAVTEHNSMDSITEILSLSKKYPDIRFIPGVEMSVSFSKGVADIVCLGLPVENVPERLKKIFTRYHEWQLEYGNAVSAALKALGFKYGSKDRLELLKKYRPARIIKKQGITHVQNGIQKEHFFNMGFISDRESGYNELMSHIYHMLPSYPDAEEVLPAIKDCGGLVIIAHPTAYFKGNDLKRMDSIREELNLDGIECAHDLVPEELTSFYRKYCIKHGLLSSAGSDSHVDPARNPYRIATQHDMARHIGKPEWLDEILERLSA